MALLYNVVVSTTTTTTTHSFAGMFDLFLLLGLTVFPIFVKKYGMAMAITLTN